MSMRNSYYMGKNVKYYKLKIYNLNLKATAKLLTESVLSTESRENIYWNNRKYLIQKKEERQVKANERQMT